MKRIVPFLVIIFLISCTKEQEPTSLTGTWTLTQINSGDTSSVILYGTEFSVQFKEKDSLFILGPKPNYSFLQDYDRYEIIGSSRIRFFNLTTGDELFAGFHIDKTLSLSYEVRCPYEEKFIRR
ncbi:MAG TPA: hypothetical protein VL095_05550 [Flavisolibacter sp.]|nr:hypothetical protein [Flavisolibacter sp.]